jgi:hypothetical protein
MKCVGQLAARLARVVGPAVALLASACFVEIIETGTSGEGTDSTAGTGETGDTDDPEVACGDGTRDEGELCDGDNLGGATCQSLGFTEGTLACADDCSFDVSGCGPQSACGDGTADADEQCDGEDFAGRDCESFGFEGGALACTSECTVDTSGCTDEPG